MSILDSIVSLGKKVLPPPAILLFSHIIFCVFGTIMLCLNLMSSPNTIWSSYVTLFVGGVPLCLGMSYIKYKQTNSIIAAIISGVVFFCTIVAIQYWPWSAWLDTTKKATGFNFVRLIILLPLSIIYGLWCKKNIEQFVYRPFSVEPNGKFSIAGHEDHEGYGAAPVEEGTDEMVAELSDDAQDTDSFL